ncbi:MAG: ABC transporter permease [Halanaerobiales bacterium]
MYYISLYIEFVKIRVQSIAEYRGSFISGAVAQFISYGADFLIIWIMINQFKTIGSWGPYEVMLLYAINLFSYGVAGFFFFNLSRELPYMIRRGEFDEVMTRPLNSLLYLITRSFNTAYVSHLTLSLITIIICSYHLNIEINLWSIIVLAIIIVSGALIQGSGFLMTTIPVFWFVDNSGFIGILFWNLKEFVRYPLSIYNRAVQILLTLIIPYGFISFYPAQYFLGKEDYLSFHPYIQYLSPLVGILLMGIAVIFWHVAINHYKSTGS